MHLSLVNELSYLIPSIVGGTRGFSDQQATLTLGGKRQVPFMIDTNGMIRFD